jgi:hypothetical protein
LTSYGDPNTPYSDSDGDGHAGYRDWRIPNYKELNSILDLEWYNPTVDVAFNTSCAGGCTVTECSCTAFNWYWSSTTYQYSPSRAYAVKFSDGGVNSYGKHYYWTSFNVRAVRGGV